MPSLKLSYFNIEARAEKVRLALVVTETPFEDFRIEREDWPKIKATTPFGQVPVLEITDDDGQVRAFAQSDAMLRYVARRFDKTGTLYPQDPDQLLEVEETCFLADDAWRELLPLLYIKNGKQEKLGHPADWKEKDEVTNALVGKFVSTEFPKIMGHLVAKLEKTGGYVCSSDHMTIADLMWLVHCRFFQSRGFGMLPEGLLEPYPSVKAWMAKMYENQHIKKWYGL
mmetsp:Transcript_38793/g.58511  ORF Transcript_38793/g.58511 Transcript_38793/m.58511 type:complete len:227 (+) Transcript_38793:83-763(+)|eukprot:CAMPEP_0194746768 /NCGR_PEP_ID=MMETSP0323_2-20130528/760_1 /TAXON_ID=2866 ORGANISM="Crypthecodinium cohnii, Strain Seligo" /NCGR_SAMPLE_ID=MMETSP0323_2 /ASSEMBLY_ACC=CAM_ASM_000346 /LENGTH=226 /DNA_ID=CAMNT_0039659505 /DNA_START=88 /DNA_END=768 /DNA_ORIENTATION=+